MNQLVFIANSLLDKTERESLRIPMQFVCFAHIKGKMYRHYRNQGTFILPTEKSVVSYGAIFYMVDFDYYSRILDAYHSCSLSGLGRNHTRDLHHRIETDVTPIRFSSIEQLERLMYEETEPTHVHAYVGNPNHPKINNRLGRTVTYRVKHDVDPHYKNLIREELHFE